MTTAAPRRPLSSLLEPPPIREVHAPRWFERQPQWLTTGGFVVLLVIISAVLRSRQLGGELWFNEAISTGIAGHSLSELPGILRQAGTSPLYYVLLHIWMSVVGSSESDTHVLSLLIGLATIPVGMWSGWSLYGRRAGFYAAVLFAFNSFLTRYAQETQMYELMVLLGLLCTTGFLHAFVYRRRSYLWLFGVSLALLTYTQAAGFLFWFGAAVALGVVYRFTPAEARRALLRDAGISFAAVAIVYLPWLPTTISQIAHATSPFHYAPLSGADVPSDLLGGERVDVTLLVACVIGVAPLLAPERRRTSDAIAIWALVALAFSAIALSRVIGLFAEAWVARYFASLIPALLLLSTLLAARARVVGLVAIVLCVAFLANPGSFAAAHKSDMRDVAGELAPLLHQGDLVVVAQPEQVPLAYYYLPAGLRWASTIGAVAHPTYMRWTNALGRLQAASPKATLTPLVASLRPGQQLLFVRPLTEGVENWKASWTQLVRRRSAQWGALLQSAVTAGTLQRVARAPHYYPSACCVADSAILYRKAS
ncbi:MAG: glycosyltransferase family 39 protein [Solirubrobacteraceae bacterium]